MRAYFIIKESLGDQLKIEFDRIINEIEKHLQKMEFDIQTGFTLDLKEIFVEKDYKLFNNDIFRKLIEIYFNGEGWIGSKIETNNRNVTEHRPTGMSGYKPIYEKYGLFLHLNI